MNRARLWMTLFIVFWTTCPFIIEARTYSWLEHYNLSNSIAHRIPVPSGFKRVTAKPNTFQHWLRHLPLKTGHPPVYLYNGKKKRNQSAHFAVVKIDVGNEDLQQCADAVIRLWAEYLYSQGKFDNIHFKFTSGDNASFRKWITGYRPVVKGSDVSWRRTADRDSSNKNFRVYLDMIFMYAGSYSLSKELQPVRNISEMQIGDIFIQGGFPGHAVIVIDMAENTKTGEKDFLLAQSYMPAQEIHILKNPSFSKFVLIRTVQKIWSTLFGRSLQTAQGGGTLDPWYSTDFGEVLRTPEWDFKKTDLKRFTSF